MPFVCIPIYLCNVDVMISTLQKRLQYGSHTDVYRYILECRFTHFAPYVVHGGIYTKDLYLGTERVLIKEEQKSKQILDNKMFVAQCPHMMNQSALRMQIPAVSRPFQAVG